MDSLKENTGNSSRATRPRVELIQLGFLTLSRKINKHQALRQRYK